MRVCSALSHSPTDCDRAERGMRVRAPDRVQSTLGQGSGAGSRGRCAVSPTRKLDAASDRPRDREVETRAEKQGGTRAKKGRVLGEVRK